MKHQKRIISVNLAAFLLVGCGSWAAAPTPVPATATATPTAETVTCVLVDRATREPVTDISRRRFAQERVTVDGTDRWREALPDYERVFPDEQGAVTLSGIPPDIYSVEAIIGETTYKVVCRIEDWYNCLKVYRFTKCEIGIRRRIET